MTAPIELAPEGPEATPPESQPKAEPTPDQKHSSPKGAHNEGIPIEVGISDGQWGSSALALPSPS
jgi:hypothetical protein